MVNTVLLQENSYQQNGFSCLSNKDIVQINANKDHSIVTSENLSSGSFSNFEDDSDNEIIIASKKRNKNLFLEDEDDINEKSKQDENVKTDDSSSFYEESNKFHNSSYPKSFSPATLKKRLVQFQSSDESSDSENEQPAFQPSCSQSNQLLTAKDAAAAIVEQEKDAEEEKAENQVSEDSSNSSDSSDDDDSPPVRIFRNPNAANIQRGFDNGSDLSEDEEKSEGSASPPLSSRRRPKRTQLPSSIDIKSETQRLIRESRVNLPYHIPEAKKLSQLLKRPDAFQSEKEKKESKSRSKVDDEFPELSDDIPKLTDDKGDSGVEVLESPKQSVNAVDNNCRSPPDSDPTNVSFSRKAQLLARVGETVPTLKPPGIEPKLRRSFDFVDLDADVEDDQRNEEISNFMQRFFKHSSLEKNVSNKKKVQFNIIRKEERPDGSGVELVPDVVTVTTNPEQDKTKQIDDYKNLRAKLTARMKQRRSEERLKRQELYKLDNEEIGNEEEEEEDDWSEEEESEEESDVPHRRNENQDETNTNSIIDDNDDADEMLEPTQPVFDTSLSNVVPASDASQHTVQSDSMSSHLTREGSMLLFEDTKKSSCSRDLSPSESSMQDQTIDPLYSSTIPPNKTKNSDLSNSSRVHRDTIFQMNSDEDSYFSERSMNASAPSPLRPEYESQFFDSNGFIRDSKTSKSLCSFLPPGGEDDNANDGNMSQLLELCSGKFQVSEIDPQVSDAESGANVNGAFMDESFGFQVEAGSSDQVKDDGFSDANNSGANDSGSEEEDEQITIVRKKKDVAESMMKNFLEEEAELSGDDVGSDEDVDEDEKEDDYEVEENDELLPKEEVIHQQVNKVHLKQLLDEDQRNIDLLQEAFVTENLDVRRNRKFRWKNIDDNLTPDFFHSDDDDDQNPSPDDTKDCQGIGDEESQWRMMRLEREEFFNSNSQNNQPDVLGIEEDSQLVRMGKTALRKKRVLSEINENSNINTGNRFPSLSRSSSFTSSKLLPSKNSFLTRKPEILSKFANFKEASVIKGAVNSDRMVFKAVSPSKKNVRVKKPIVKQPETKRPRLDEDSNSIFNLFEV